MDTLQPKDLERVHCGGAAEWLLAQTPVIERIKAQRLEEDRLLRESLERKRDERAEYMKSEFDKCVPTAPAQQLGRAYGFCCAMASYILARRELEAMGWNAGPWPQWYIDWKSR